MGIIIQWKNTKKRGEPISAAKGSGFTPDFHRDFPTPMVPNFSGQNAPTPLRLLLAVAVFLSGLL
jgi:hypothetical protein